MRSHIVHWLEGFMPSGIAAVIAPNWFTLIGMAGLVTLIMMIVIGKRRGIEAGTVASIILWGYLAAIVAGIVVPSAIDAVEQFVMTGRARVRWAGMTSFWGYLAGFGAMAAVCRANRIPFARFGDLAVVPLGFALVFSRLGCFVAGCDYGKVTSVPWAMRFPTGSPAWRDHVRAGLVPGDRVDSLPVHPTQLYEALLGLVIVAVAMLVTRQRWGREGTGRAFLAGIATYAIGRIGIEELRGDLGRGIYLGMSSGQIFSIVLLAAIASGFVVVRRFFATSVAAAALVLVLGDLHPAHAQPGAPQPPAPMTPTVSSPPTSHLHGGLLVGMSTAINRRADQVPMSSGPTLSIGWVGSMAGVWLDLDSYGNGDAAHGTVLVSGGVLKQANYRLSLGARAGIGATLVNFDESSFQDVGGTTFRFEALAEFAFSTSWVIWARPISFDVLSAPDLGGPIATFQMRVGVGFRFGLGGTKAAAPAPLPQPYPQPYPQQQPQPYPQPYPPAPSPAAAAPRSS